MATGTLMAGKKKNDERPAESSPEQDPGDEKGTIYTTTARLTPEFMYRLKQIANREGRRAGRRVPVGEIIERQMADWVAEQWEEIRKEK